MPLRATARALRERTTTARDLLEACLARIDALQPATNAFITVTADRARRAADDADAELRAGHDRGLLHGIPVSLKDLLDEAGIVTTAGSRSMTRVADVDAPAVANLRAQGAVFVGHTNMHEFAMGTTSEDSGFGPVRHPRDGTRVAGGSSGGAAVSVATGMSHVAIGSDTGGSIRIPAAACGLVGLKPAWNDVTLRGVVPLSPTLDCLGPLAASVEDAWYALGALRSSGALPALPDVADLQRLRIGVLRHVGWHLVEPAILEVIDAALQGLAGNGVRLEDVDLPSMPFVVSTYGTIVIREALDFHTPRLPLHADAYTPAVRTRLQTAPRPSDAEYGAALEARARIEADVDALLARVDVLALPGLAIAPPPLGQSHVRWPAGEELTRAAMLRLTQPFNLSRHPAIVLPAGTTRDGWSASLQLVGRSTVALVSAALAIEQRLPVTLA